MSPNASHTFRCSSLELRLLLHTAGLKAQEESPFSELKAPASAQQIETTAMGLVRKAWVDKRTRALAPELGECLSVLAAPDAKVVVLQSGPGQVRRILEVYSRKEAYVEYQKKGSEYHFSGPESFFHVEKLLHERFSARGSTGDYLSLELSASAHAALWALAESPHANQKWHGETSLLSTLEKANKRGFGVHGPAEFNQVLKERQLSLGLKELSEHQVVDVRGQEYSPRPYLFDFMQALASKERFVLTRFDYLPGHEKLRDSTLMVAPGSLFWLLARPDNSLQVFELSLDQWVSLVEGTLAAPLAGA